MLSARRDIPLAHVMTDSIKIDGRDLPVRESWVMLELENAQNEILTVRRAVKSGNVDRTLIQTWRQPILSERISPAESRDYFVRRKGAAQREAGFHHMLAKFMGWDLPRVSRMDGSEGPLYLECLFPFFYVEQKHGWSGVQARIPTYLGIRDVARRTAEFILSLDEYQAVLQRHRLESAASTIEAEWSETFQRLRAVADSAAIVVSGIAPKPTIDAQSISAQLSVLSHAEWVPLAIELQHLRTRLNQLTQVPVSKVGETAAQLEVELTYLQTSLVATNSALVEATAAREETRARLNSVELRVAALKEDLQRHRDVALLQRLGSTHSALPSDDLFCPTCDQSVPDGFEITDNPMTVEQSIDYIEQELRTFRSMHRDFMELLKVEDTKVRTLRQDADEIRRQVRSIKDSLMSPSATPSVAELTERLRLEEQITGLGKAHKEISDGLQGLLALVEPWHRNREAIAALKARSRTPLDERKIDHLQRSVVQQLRMYHFSSLEPDSVEISTETYRPTHEGFDLGFDISASDMVRVIWAYLLGILETATAFDSNHPRFLMFDEPRQQETKEISFAALLERAARNGTSGAQIIFATSWPEKPLREMLADLPHRLISIPPETKLLGPVQE
ncbi:hypothetical protein [Actinomadura oligospora]|uniref:hypothetical protein n=1 Tax=Actinomadura oligospora TaxID=111804 RepID=UPI0012FC907B